MIHLILNTVIGGYKQNELRLKKIRNLMTEQSLQKYLLFWIIGRIPSYFKFL